MANRRTERILPTSRIPVKASRIQPDRAAAACLRTGSGTVK